ncbi:MAG: hypothetical protein PHG98_04245 [Bacteroidales bacterium]|jgi:hypothetical protein|nr:hypothetical protein [Bacteroidales bacterium]NCC18653.1 hypothetical protein [Bacteroidia bacterium]MDD2576621.1 hypothetical protein [Bacteroidales bacterium]MDD3287281.1 hypothetical protein [Bacteroidales bacterium]MDD4068081.1 hypothetical protein [Bacteroidales bacterium]
MAENYIFDLLTLWEEDLFENESSNQEETSLLPSNKVITTILSYANCERFESLTLNHDFELCLN